MMIVSIYLVAIVVANLSIAAFGPSATVAVAFLFIGLDLSVRDRLHDAWRRKGLVRKMGTLIATGGLLSYLMNADAGPIAIASCVAFAAAAVIDAAVYHALRSRPFLLRANGSNIPAAAADSIIFPTLAFGGFLPGIVLGQFAAKIAGGFLWSLVLKQISK